MNENAKKWVEALRSKSYEQGGGALRCEQLFCCLGVACDIYAKETGAGEWEGNIFIANDHTASVVLPQSVRAWLGLTDDAGGYADGQCSLACDNDEGKSFEEIATIIESNEDLFTNER